MNVHLTRNRAALALAGLLLTAAAPTAYATLDTETAPATAPASTRGTPYVETRYPVAAGASDRKIEEIRRAYEKAFAQESVGRVDDRTRADF
ncbi:DUF3574 domain-containing protein [Streptomyces sp. NPDC002276]